MSEKSRNFALKTYVYMMTPDQIMAEIGDSALYTLHAHTQFCDARAPMADFAERAAAMGFTHYGFTPHSPVPIYSTCNMSQADVVPFLEEVDRLQALYPKVKFYKGMEVDYLGDDWGASIPYFQQLPLDYMISSVHFVPNQEGVMHDIDGRPAHFQEKLHTAFHDDLRYVVERFFEQSQRMVAAGGYQIIGHFDKIKHNASTCQPDLEQTDWYNCLVNDLIDSIIASDTIVEINTKAWQEFQQMFPAQRHWRRLIAAGVPIVVNSDAHYVDRINADRPAVLKSLRYLRSHLA